MTKTLAEDIADDLYSVMLATSDFAETVTYYPGGGGASRSVVALVRHDGQSRRDGPSHYDEDRIIVIVGNDEDHAKGGVESPAWGTSPDAIDCLLRSGDSETQKYAFTGQRRQIAGGWELHFSRPVAKGYGTAHRKE